MSPWTLGSGLYDGVLAFVTATGALVLICLALEGAFFLYDRLCWWAERRGRSR